MERLPSLYALLAAALFVGVTAIGRSQPTELFFSEYIEGSSNNKALEISNGTGAPVDLAAGAYNVQMYFNGNPLAGLTINLTGSVVDGDVYVIAQASAGAAILAQADQTSGAGWFNGDDAVVLRKGTTVLDVIGQIGLDPGTEWGTGLLSTADNTLRRNLVVAAGDTDGSNAFDPSAEWTGFATDTFFGLGCHTAELVCPTPPPPPPVEKEIFEIQGNGLASPFVGQAVATKDNVVTAVFSDGFFIQTPSARADANPETSNGLFVFTTTAPTVSVGDQVDVTGTVAEFFNFTEIDATAVSADSSGNALPPAVVFDETTPSKDQPQPATEMERFEGMRVRVENGTVSSPTNQFGEASVVAASQRVFREPGIIFPGLPGLPVWDGNPEIFEIDTDRFAPSPGLRMAGGAIVTAEGPLAFSFSDYQIWPTTLTVAPEAQVIPVRDRNPGEFTVGSQNVLRLFDLVNDPNVEDEVPTPQRYAERLSKLSLQIRGALKTPDVVVVQEAENLTVLQDVAARIDADQLAAALPALHYTPYLLEGNDIGGIDIGFLVRPTVQVDSVEQFGKDDVFVFPGSPSAPLNDRPPLVLRGSYVGGTVPFPIVVIGVHQRSLSGIDGSDGPRVRAKRFEQALRLSQYIQGLQTGDASLRLVVIGDFNAFEFTDGYVDVMGQVTGNPDPAGALLPATDEIDADLTNQTLNMPAADRYSFVFDGTAQSLDHAITSQALDSWIRGAQHSRGNADAPFAFDVDSTTPLRSSDHDGTVLFVMGDNDGDGFPDDGDACTASSTSSTVVIDGCNSGAGNDLFSDGCKITDRIAACAASALTHDAFTQCVTLLTNQLKRDGFITSKEKGDIQKCAGRARIP
jgi:predicted extracellular nuclease